MFDDLPQDGESNEGEEFEPDMATVAFLDQQQAEFEGMKDDFFNTYGFEHDCHCGEDYAAGRVGEITQCYHNMMQEALATCARLNIELKEMTGIAKALYEEVKDNLLQSEPKPATDESVSVDSGNVRESGGSSGDSAAADAAGEGLGSASYDVGAKDESGESV